MFVDNKDFPCLVRGGTNAAFVLVCYKTRAKAKFKVDITTKKHNGKAFRRLMALNGVHLLPYHCRVWSDGCGSMVHVVEAAVSLGIDHAYVPPHEQSLNETEKVCDRLWAVARTPMLESGAPDALFSLALDYATYVDLRMATASSRGWVTSYEAIKGVAPSVLHLRPFYTSAAVRVPN